MYLSGREGLKALGVIIIVAVIIGVIVWFAQ
jgi:hypothetical protein